MKIALAADHAGYDLKELLKKELREMGHEVLDLGTNEPEKATDYPDFAELVGNTLLARQAERGILVCGSGVGVCVAANKFPGVRAGTFHDIYSAHQGVEHDDMNVLCLGARILGVEVAREVVRAYVGARFSEDERHRRRLAKILSFEKRFFK